MMRKLEQTGKYHSLERERERQREREKVLVCEGQCQYVWEKERELIK